MCCVCVCVSHMVNEKLEQPSSISLTSHFFSGLPLRDLISLGLWTYTSNSGTSDSGHSEERTTSLQWTNCVPPANNWMHVRTSEEGTKHSSPTCPLFGGSTVCILGALNYVNIYTL